MAPKRKSTSTPDRDQLDESGEEGSSQKQSKRGRKVHRACVYCRRSHMTCDEQRPCQRCIKRDIGHMCYDEAPRPKNGPARAGESPSLPDLPQSQPNPTPQTIGPGPSTVVSTNNAVAPHLPPAPMADNWAQFLQPAPFSNVYATDNLGSEFNALTDFLESLDDRTFFNQPSSGASFPNQMSYDPNSQGQIRPQQQQQPQQHQHQHQQQQPMGQSPRQPQMMLQPQSQPPQQQQQQPLPPPLNISTSYGPPQGMRPAPNSASPDNAPVLTPVHTIAPAPLPTPAVTEENVPNILPAATKTEKFLLTAADQESGSRNERLNRVIRAKYEAGLLKPYNYVKGYARLSRWMDRNVSQDSKQAILQPLSVLRPNFRAVAQSLTDMELVLIEESFERLLLDYDRVFSAMAIPACLWRRTGEIYKGNREFAELVGVDGHMLREGRLCIYELMAEESAVNYWEKYGQIAFDSTQKAILTSCVLRYKPTLNVSNASGSASPATYRNSTQNPNQAPQNQNQQNGSANGNGNGGAGGSGAHRNEEGFIHCTFSFTIRRDAWGIPSMIVGNFIKC